MQRQRVTNLNYNTMVISLILTQKKIFFLSENQTLLEKRGVTGSLPLPISLCGKKHEAFFYIHSNLFFSDSNKIDLTPTNIGKF